MKWFLLFALLPLHATAPTPFTFQGYDTLAQCERAKTVIAHPPAAMSKQVIAWVVCVPTKDADPQ